jgi:hypothetical protein
MIGATTTLACFAHEITHEIADYSILIRSGFTKRQAMQSQFLTAVGAFVSSIPWNALHACSRSLWLSETRVSFHLQMPNFFVWWTDFRIFIWPDVSPGWVSPAQ